VWLVSPLAAWEGVSGRRSALPRPAFFIRFVMSRSDN
jgi:hypothetical protein